MQATCLCFKMTLTEKMQFSSYWHLNWVKTQSVGVSVNLAIELLMISLQGTATSLNGEVFSWSLVS